MRTRGTLRAVLACFTAAIASGVNVPRPAGTKVYSVSVWSGHWLDGLIMRCTGDSDEEDIPEEFNDDPGGDEDADICAGTGGVQSLQWEDPVDYAVILYLNITCLDNQTYQFADGVSAGAYGTTETRTASCDEGEYVQGLSYSVYRPEDATSHSYYLHEVGLMCSSATLSALCTDCSGDSTLLSEEDQPEYCELPTCSEAECCGSNTGDEDDSITDEIIIGIVSTVAAAAIVSASAWTFQTIKNKTLDGKGVDGFRAEDVQS